MPIPAPIPAPTVPRLLVVGGTGRLGGLLRRAWMAPGGAGALRALHPVWQARAEGQGGDILFDPLTAPAAFARAAGAADVVLNLAGVVSGTADQLADNRRLALAAAAAAAEAGVPLLQASSAAVYGAQAGPLSEDGPTQPAAPYGQAKLEAEEALEALAPADRSPAIVLLRIGNVAGADALLGGPAPAEGRVLDIFPDGRAPRRSYIGPQALAEALARLVRLLAGGIAVPGRINLALPGAVGMDALLGAAGATWAPRPAPTGAIPEVTLDVARALALDLIPETPAQAAAIVADLATLPPMQARR